MITPQNILFEQLQSENAELKNENNVLRARAKISCAFLVPFPRGKSTRTHCFSYPFAQQHPRTKLFEKKIKSYNFETNQCI